MRKRYCSRNIIHPYNPCHPCSRNKNFLCFLCFLCGIRFSRNSEFYAVFAIKNHLRDVMGLRKYAKRRKYCENGYCSRIIIIITGGTKARQNVEQGEFRRLKNLYLASLALETTKNKTS